MASLNKIMVIGNAGRDPEMRYTPNGHPVTTFSVATNRTYTGQDGERKEETEWFTVVAWNGLAERLSQQLTKGSRVYVEGRLRSHTYQGSDGQTRFRNEIIANYVLSLDRPGESPYGGGYGSAADLEPAGVGTGTSPDDLPF